MEPLDRQINLAWETADRMQGDAVDVGVKRELALVKTALEDAGSRVLRAETIARLGSVTAA